MYKAGRPPTKPARLMDGFYVEVRNKMTKEKGIRIRSESKAGMENIARLYAANKEVTVLGEYKDDEWLIKPETPKKKHKADPVV
jgi:hypothetical protein